MQHLVVVGSVDISASTPTILCTGRGDVHNDIHCRKVVGEVSIRGTNAVGMLIPAHKFTTLVDMRWMLYPHGNEELTL